MVKEKPDRVMFESGDDVKIFLSDSSTVTGRIVREDLLGITIVDLQDATKYRFIKWDAVNIIEYSKNGGKNGK